MKKLLCRHCNEEIILSKEDLELISEGYIQTPDSYNDCSNNNEEVYEFSDADPGL